MTYSKVSLTRRLRMTFTKGIASRKDPLCEYIQHAGVAPRSLSYPTSALPIYGESLSPKVVCPLNQCELRSISNNPIQYSDPDRFNPDRFLDPNIPDAPAFGFGRRCEDQSDSSLKMFNW